MPRDLQLGMWLCIVELLCASSFGAESSITPLAANDQLIQEVVAATKDAVVEMNIPSRDGQQTGVGTGFIVSSDGLIVTNLHVIGEARRIQVKLADKRTFSVETVHASDRAMDLAIVKIKATNLPSLTLAEPATLSQGQVVVAVGNPLGLTRSVVAGVSSGSREIDGRRMIQLAMPIEPGNSGSPLIDLKKRVHGVIAMKSALTENLGFAIGIADVLRLLEKPNPIPIKHWVTIGAIDDTQWDALMGARWQQRAGRILVSGVGHGFGGRSLCLRKGKPAARPYEVGTFVKLDDEAGAAGLVFEADGKDRHYGFYPTGGKLRLTRFDGPNVFTWNILREIHTPHYKPGQWNYLKVRLEPKGILCFVNDQLVIESTDTGLSEGRLGLAKFRQTQAEFKQFNVAEKLPPSQLDRTESEKILVAVERLPSQEALSAKMLQDLSQISSQSATVIHAHADSLEQKAAEMRKLADDVHVISVTNQISKVTKTDDFNLLSAALLISRLDNPEVDVESYKAEVDRMARIISDRLDKEADAGSRLAMLEQYLFSENGFHGSRSDYYHPANSHMDRVIDDREGLPITLSVLYMELAHRLDVPITGISLPGHFVVQHRVEGEQAPLIDVFDRANRLDQKEAARKVEETVGRPLRDDDLRPASKREIILRMLRNLLGLAESKKDSAGMLRYLEAMIAVEPDSAQSRGMRAVMRFTQGRHDDAIDDLDWIIQNQPPGIELDRIYQLRENFQSSGRSR